MSTDEFNQRILRQNEVIISLLGRLAFTEDQVREIIVKNKQESKREGYVKGYNACDGMRTTREIASIAGVSPGTLSPIINDWETLGIIYEVGRPKGKSAGKYYKKLFPIDE